MQLITPKIIGVQLCDSAYSAQYAQRVGAILNDNAERRKHSDEDWQNSDPDIKPAGSIPRVIWMLWEQAGITGDDKELLKALERNPEYKTTEKQLI